MNVFLVCLGYRNRINESLCQPDKSRCIPALIRRLIKHWNIFYGLVFCVSFGTYCLLLTCLTI